VTIIVDVALPPWSKAIATRVAARVKSEVIVSPRFCEWLRLPLVPVIEIVADDPGVPGSTLTVATEAIEPPDGGVTLSGENETCTPLANPSALNVTAELNNPTEVTVTVSVLDVPAPTARLDALRAREKSAPEAIVRAKEVTRAPDELVPRTSIVLVPTGALEAILMLNVVVALPPEGIEIGFGLNVEKVTPAGTTPVTDNVTGPKKEFSDIPVIVTMPEPPCGIEIVDGAELRL